ncbi:hypothetical protein BsWGS_12817 [Bradybaena similaris]
MKLTGFRCYQWHFDVRILVWLAITLNSPQAEVKGKRVPQDENQEFKCNENIESHTHRNGTISSPNHPAAYPASVECWYNFTGVGRERIQLRFLHIDLYFPTGDPASPIECGSLDSVSVFVLINGEEKLLNTWCGRKLPPMLMSNQPKMMVQFLSTEHSAPTVTGFKAQYSFVTNFGIHQGVQDNRGTCAFNYQSSVNSSGEITSPNYRGLYPRSTECHYLFYGRGNERVQITFTDFDVDGLNPRCEESTKSDYVSFSNFADTEDRKMTRLCGQSPKEGRVIWSDGPFFRVTFKSNDIYDSTGFKATYKFRGFDENKEDNHNHPVSDRGAGTYEVQGQKSNSANSNYILSDRMSHTAYLLLTSCVTVVCTIVVLFNLPPSIYS